MMKIRDYSASPKLDAFVEGPIMARVVCGPARFGNERSRVHVWLGENGLSYEVSYAPGMDTLEFVAKVEGLLKSLRKAGFHIAYVGVTVSGLGAVVVDYMRHRGIPCREVRPYSGPRPWEAPT